jgi:FKBP-type peptidyl-prolyl cis-trans isomerase 2
MLFPPGTPVRIPIAAVTGTNGKTTTSRMLAHIQKMNGHTVGLATTDGVYIDGERTVAGDMTGPTSAQMVLRDPSIDLAVLETARGGLIRAGMGYRTCNVGAVLNVTADHLGLKGIDTVEQLAEVKRIVVEVARDCAVLNADDINCLKMADHTKASRIAYVTMNPRHELVRKHLRAGGLASVLEEALLGHGPGSSVELQIEPEQAFGDFNDQLIFLEPRTLFPAELEEGQLFEGASLPDGCNPDAPKDALYCVTDIYPEHVVLDGNHPLAGIAIRLHVRVQAVREATEAEIGQGSTGSGFFRLQAPHTAAPGSDSTH